MDYIGRYQSPLGGITLGSDGDALTGLWFDGQKYFGAGLSGDAEERELPVFAQARRWLDIYFSGRSPDFTPPLRESGSPFRLSVWAVLKEIPFGETVTYREIARRIARDRGLETLSAQAVGGAVGHNPISLIIPCHRVVGSSGSLTGYAGGLDRKARLLALEGADMRDLFIPTAKTAGKISRHGISKSC